jgi:hypothetical protein
MDQETIPMKPVMKPKPVSHNGRAPKPKKRGRPPTPENAARECWVAMACTKRYKAWVDHHGRYFGGITGLVEAAIQALAKERGFKKPPER